MQPGSLLLRLCLTCALLTLGSNAEINCPPGYYLTPAGFGIYKCTGCEAGNACPGGTQNPVLCITNNQRQPLALQSTCVECEKHTFSDATTNVWAPGRKGNTEKCEPCPPTLPWRSEGLPKCMVCPSGQTCQPDAAPQACPLGTFKEKPGPQDCTQCSLGTFSPLTGSTACELCGPGKYSGVKGASACTLCEAGKWNADTRSSSCQQCSVGTYWSDTGRNTSCPMCEVGKYRGDWLGGCASCDQNTYNDMKGAEACTPCPSDQTTAGAGATSLSNCTCPITAFRSAGVCVGCENQGVVPSLNFVGGEDDCTCPSGKYLDPDTGKCTNCGACIYGQKPVPNACEETWDGPQCTDCYTCREGQRVTGETCLKESADDSSGCSACKSNTSSLYTQTRPCTGKSKLDTSRYDVRIPFSHAADFVEQQCQADRYPVKTLDTVWDAASVAAPWADQNSNMVWHPFADEYAVIAENGLWVYTGFPMAPSPSLLLYNSSTKPTYPSFITGAYSQLGDKLYVLDRLNNVWRYTASDGLTMYAEVSMESLSSSDFAWGTDGFLRPHCDTVPEQDYVGAPVLFCAADDEVGATQLFVVRRISNKLGARNRLQYRRMGSLTLGLFYDWQSSTMLWSFYTNANQESTNAYLVRLSPTYEVMGLGFSTTDVDETGEPSLRFEGSFSATSAAIHPSVEDRRMYFLTYEGPLADQSTGQYKLVGMDKARVTGFPGSAELSMMPIPPIQTDWYVSSFFTRGYEYFIYQTGKLWKWTQCRNCPKGMVSGSNSNSIQDCKCKPGYRLNGTTGDPSSTCVQHDSCLPGQYLHTAGTPSSNAVCKPCATCNVGEYMDVFDASAGVCTHLDKTARGNVPLPTRCKSCTECNNQNLHAPGECAGDGTSDTDTTKCTQCKTCDVGEYIVERCAPFGMDGKVQCATCSGCNDGYFIQSAKCSGSTIGDLIHNTEDCAKCCPEAGKVPMNASMCAGRTSMVSYDQKYCVSAGTATTTTTPPPTSSATTTPAPTGPPTPSPPATTPAPTRPPTPSPPATTPAPTRQPTPSPPASPTPSPTITTPVPTPPITSPTTTTPAPTASPAPGPPTTSPPPTPSPTHPPNPATPAPTPTRTTPPPSTNSTTPSEPVHQTTPEQVVETPAPSPLPDEDTTWVPIVDTGTVVALTVTCGIIIFLGMIVITLT